MVKTDDSFPVAKHEGTLGCWIVDKGDSELCRECPDASVTLGDLFGPRFGSKTGCQVSPYR